MKIYPLSYALLLLVVLGASVFVWRISGADPGITWQVFLINVLFFSAIAQSGAVLAAIYHLTEARWGSRIIALALGLGSFLPISFILFGVLLVGFPYFPTYPAELPSRHAWFNPSFFLIRNFLGIAVLYSVSLVFSYRFLNAAKRTSASGKPYMREISEDVEGEIDQPPGGHGREVRLTGLAVLVLVVYAIVFSLLGIDFVMGLDRQWYSTLFGGYFFISSVYIGLAALAIIAVVAKQTATPKVPSRTDPLRDLGKLIFAFCFLTAYLFWAQYLVTWYGNLPEEIGFFMRRFHDPSWTRITWTAIILTFGIPFLTLLPQRAKQSATVLSIVSVVALLGMWIERYVLVGPSLTKAADAGLGWTEFVITLGFLAAMACSYRVYLQFYPLRE